MERPMKDANGFFYEFKQIFANLKVGLKGRYLRLIGLILLIAVPTAVVDAYSNDTLANAVLPVLPTIDFTSQTSIEALFNTASYSTPTGFVPTILSLLVSLLQCTVFLLAAIYTWQCLRKKNNYLDDSTAFAKRLLRKLPIAFVISYLSSYLLSSILQMCIMSASIFLFVPILFISIPLMLLSAFVIYCILSAAVDCYASVMLASCAIGRVRFLASLYYARLLYKGNFFKTAVYFTIVNAVTSVLSIIPMAVAMYFSFIQSPASYFLWVLTGIVQCLLSGLSMCFYTARMLQLEKKNEEYIRPHSFIVTDDDEPADSNGPHYSDYN